MTLFEIYNKYRSGNKDVFSKLATDKVRYDKSGNYDHGDFVIIPPLKSMSDLLYRKYSVPYKRPHDRYPKYYSAAYNGTIQDMRKDIVLVLLRLLNDENFTAESEEHGKQADSSSH